MKIFKGCLILLLASAALTSVACGGSGDFLSPEEKAGKKIFKYSRGNAFRSLDPMKQFDASSSAIITNVYDPLLEYAYLARPYKLKPSLLTKMPEQQADKVTYIFEMKKDVKFHDADCFEGGKGREVTADDAIYSIKRFADANVNRLSWSLFEGFVVGLDDFRKKTAEMGKDTNYDKMPVSGIKKLDKYRFSIQFTRDNPLAFYPMAMGQMSVVPREAVEKYGDEFERKPVGTGPFYVKKMDRQGTIILAKNENYHQNYPTEGAPGDKEKGF